MEFELTPEITDEIIFAMEDQSGRFLYDSVECRCADSRSLSAGQGKNPDEDEERYYAIPQWDSVSGFRMMDRFVSQLRNPVAREELRAALSSGHGVFRNFKNILKARGEVERLWYQFKEREMRNIVHEWYNGLRDFWGLERIGPEPEETGEIVSQDFAFRPYVPDDENELETLIASVEAEIAGNMSAELSEAIGELWDRIRGEDDGTEYSIVAENSEGEIVAVALSSPIPDGSFLSVQITFIAVYPEFRGMGIGKELLSRTVGYWTERGYRWILFTSPIVPSEFFPVLRRAGFTGKGHVSVLDLASIPCH
jgi:ribosomal protein S18 acetylase RimI-like enzyme